ncbi:MAG: sulfatase [Bacteroidales bacterium]|nr:sulfatase [Bacteroidales bacterium]
MKRIYFISLGVLLFSCNPKNEHIVQGPNILFIMSDDHAKHALSCYGGNIDSTPNIDRLAEEGMMFNHCMVTNSLCAPSRAAILTGKYGHLNSVKINREDTFDNTQEHLGKWMTAAGYQTALIGKWHLRSEPTGFDYWKILPGQGEYWDPEMIETGKKSVNKGYVTNIITDETINWIKNRDKNKPFFVMTHHKAPHVDHHPGNKHKHLYTNVDLPIPENFHDDFSTRKARHESILRWTSFDSINVWDRQGDPPAGLTNRQYREWCYQNFFKGYYRVCESLDENVGRLIDFIDDSGLKENTIVIYISDNGFFLGDHGWYNKMWMYEESLHIPFVIRYPKEIKPGTINDDLVMNIDFAPTFLDYAGIAIPDDIQGSSIRQLFTGNTPASWRKTVYYRYFDRHIEQHYGIRTNKYKLIYYPGLKDYELFDLELDLHEMNNVFDDQAYSEIAEMLKAELKRTKEKYEDYE